MPHGPRGMVPNNVLRFTTGVKKARADWVGPNMPKIATHNFRSRHNKAWILCSWSVSRRGLSSSKPAWEEEEEDLKKPAFSGPRADQHRWSVGHPVRMAWPGIPSKNPNESSLFHDTGTQAPSLVRVGDCARLVKRQSSHAEQRRTTPCRTFPPTTSRASRECGRQQAPEQNMHIRHQQPPTPPVLPGGRTSKHNTPSPPSAARYLRLQKSCKRGRWLTAVQSPGFHDACPGTIKHDRKREGSGCLDLICRANPDRGRPPPQISSIAPRSPLRATIPSPGFWQLYFSSEGAVPRKSTCGEARRHGRDRKATDGGGGEGACESFFFPWAPLLSRCPRPPRQTRLAHGSD